MPLKNTPPPVAPGQVWIDLDPRQHRRKILVHRIEGAFAHCSILKSGRTTQLDLKRFNGRRNGYEIAEEITLDLTLEQSVWRTLDSQVQAMLRPRQTEWTDAETGKTWKGPQVTKTRKAVLARYLQLLGPTLRI